MSNKSKRNSNVSQSPDLESIISWLDSKVKYIGAQLILQLETLWNVQKPSMQEQ